MNNPELVLLISMAVFVVVAVAAGIRQRRLEDQASALRKSLFKQMALTYGELEEPAVMCYLSRTEMDAIRSALAYATAAGFAQNQGAKQAAHDAMERMDALRARFVGPEPGSN